ncbi:MAG: hypothetical protein LBJ41_05105 [Treponema sp.]|nr:hypothetical protein [Treponema sp.]
MTNGKDCPGLNAAIQDVCRAAHDRYAMSILGIVNDRSIPKGPAPRGVRSANLKRTRSTP